jgi:hypothetical protein
MEILKVKSKIRALNSTQHLYLSFFDFLCFDIPNLRIPKERVHRLCVCLTPITSGGRIHVIVPFLKRDSCLYDNKQPSKV